MVEMFYRADAFNQPLDKWGVSKVRHMGSMFYSASKFNQPLGYWVVSNVSTMAEMFKCA